jgi:hydroxymethylpyrimidine/phosphomethylpyrimidine kinase
MVNPNPENSDAVSAAPESDDERPACVMCFNASDPSGAGGLAGDVTAIASVGAHALSVVTGAYARDTAEIFEHFAFDEEVVAEQARAILEDVPVQVIKVGFVGSPENISTVAALPPTTPMCRWWPTCPTCRGGTKVRLTCTLTPFAS